MDGAFPGWPRFGYGFSIWERTVYDIAATLGLLVVPLGFFVFRDPGWLAATLPALYSHGVYAVASHFIPRYSVPEAPLRIVGLALSVYLVALLLTWART